MQLRQCVCLKPLERGQKKYCIECGTRIRKAMQRSNNEWQRTKEMGLLGSCREMTWNGQHHQCCLSRAYWRHTVKCPRANKWKDL